MRRDVQHFQSDDKSFQVQLGSAEIRKILRFCTDAKGNETGGILVGKYVYDRACVKVTQVGGPTDDSEAGRSWFVRGVRGLQEWVDSFWRSGAGYYVGEWHFHPGASPEPSHQDIDQILEISRTKQYNCPEPVLVILGGNPKLAWTMSATVATRSGKVIRLHDMTSNEHAHKQTALNERN